jgi:hypothetical protein
MIKKKRFLPSQVANDVSLLFALQLSQSIDRYKNFYLDSYIFLMYPVLHDLLYSTTNQRNIFFRAIERFTVFFRRLTGNILRPPKLK